MRPRHHSVRASQGLKGETKAGSYKGCPAELQPALSCAPLPRKDLAPWAGLRWVCTLSPQP